MFAKIDKTKFKHTFSMRVPLFILFMFIGIFPMLIEGIVMNRAFRQTQIDALVIELQNQCLITSDQLSRAGYLSSPDGRDSTLDNELDTIADMFNGRIVLVDRNFRIVKDTFGLAEGRFNISEPVIQCFKGTNSMIDETDRNYFVLTTPIYSGEDQEEEINGVFLMTVSTEGITDASDTVADMTARYQVVAIGVLILFALLMVVILMKPYERLLNVLNRVADGNLNETISENAYKETKSISDSIQSTITQLKTMDQSREEFVSNVSHELKTPITSIRVLADSLMSMDDAPVELYREFMSDISDEIDRENKIIDDLLSLVKLDKSAAGLNIDQADINIMIQDIMKRLSPIAKKNNIDLIYESIRDVTADVDEVKLSLAISNLVENAIKYNIDNGWVHVTLDADHKYFYVKVTDSGIGIPEENQDQIFERFYRVDKSRSSESGGTGLGLSITKNIVLMHHGSIKLSSKEGEGSTFTVRIPLNYIP